MADGRKEEIAIIVIAIKKKEKKMVFEEVMLRFRQLAFCFLSFRSTRQSTECACPLVSPTPRYF